jgi:predicted 2-oxoglutarate/Fe(II)-dependent dioxygenase YbiX
MSRLGFGERAPSMALVSPVNPRFSFDSLGGRYVLLAFLPGPGPERDAALAQVQASRRAFENDGCVFFGVLPDAESYDCAQNRPPLRWFADLTGEVRRAFGAADAEGALTPQWMLFDPTLRLMGVAPLSAAAQVLARVEALGPTGAHAGVELTAPVLIVPRVFEPDFCRHLIDLYVAEGGRRSGVMRHIDGKTVGMLTDTKSRRDVWIEDEALQGQIRARISRRLGPEIERAFQYKATRIERYIVACYDAAEGGFFAPHRDNTAPGTAHRRFAVSINLNAEEFEGGDLRFPEYGAKTYRPPTGGAVVFSCSLMHEATPVTQGVRYACLPFLYDDAAAEIRRENSHTVVFDPDYEAEANA